MWKAELDRTGRLWGFNYQFNGARRRLRESVRVRAADGDHQPARAFNRFSYYGKPGARVESIIAFFGPTRIWQYDNFALPDAYEGQESFNAMFRLRGGWNVSLNGSRNFFTFDQRTYSGLYIVGPGSAAAVRAA